MAYYVDNERRFAISFDGIDQGWRIGYLPSMESIGLNKFLFKFKLVECPTDINNWKEHFDGEWNPNLNAKLSATNINATDYSKWWKYSGARFE